MKNRASLTTAALLSTLWDTEQRDYLDLLGQFILRCLPCKVDSQVNIGVITDKLRNDYGFTDIPQHVVENVLSRLCKKSFKTKPYLRRQDREYYVLSVFDHCSFDSVREETTDRINDVLTALVTYLENNYLHKKISMEEASELLFHFFESYGLTVVHDSDSLRAITAKNGTYNFNVARFVLENYDKNSPVFDKLLKITSGFLIHKAVYFYANEMRKSLNSKLKKITFYLDCSLVIDALGYDEANDENALDELCQLVRSNGGRINVFRHTVEEASHVLGAYAYKAQFRNSFSLMGLASRNYPVEILATIASMKSIEENLEKKGISTFDAPSYDATKTTTGKSEYIGFEDEVAIEQQLSKYSSTKSAVMNGDRPRYDTQTLSAIGRLRKGLRPRQIEDCIAIVITQGSMLNNCMRELYPERFPAEIEYAINDLDLVSLLWLGQHNEESQLPKNLLISNAVAACQISQTIMEQAIELACRMERDNTIPSEAALIIRSKSAIRPILFEETRNDPTNLKESTIHKVIKKYVSQESQEEVETAVDKAVKDKEAKLNDEYSKEVGQIQNELERERESKRQQAITMRNDAEKEANKKADCAALWTRIFVFVAWLMILSVSIFFWVGSGWVATNFQAIIVSILGLVQLVDFIFKFYDHKTRLANWVRDIIFAKVHSKEIKKREEISHISLTL